MNKTNSVCKTPDEAVEKCSIQDFLQWWWQTVPECQCRTVRGNLTTFCWHDLYKYSVMFVFNAVNIVSRYVLWKFREHLCQCFNIFWRTVLWRYWLGDSKHIHPVKYLLQQLSMVLTCGPSPSLTSINCRKVGQLNKNQKVKNAVVGHLL